GGGACAIRKRRDRCACDRACRADVLADHGVWQQRFGGSPRRNDADRREDRRAAGNAGLSGGRVARATARILRGDDRNRQALPGVDRRHARRGWRFRGDHPLNGGRAPDQRGPRLIPYCCGIPAASRTASHRLYSPAMKSPKASGVDALTTTPAVARRSRTVWSARLSLSVLFSLAITGAGVLRGANRPYQVVTS